MEKRNFKFVTALAIALLLSTGVVTTHAAAVSNSSSSSNVTSIQNKHREGCSGPINSTLQNKLGFSKEQIDTAAKSGKTAFDLGKEKGKTSAEVKNMLIEEQSKHIDQKVSEGKFTKEEAVTIKTKMNARIQKWDGSLKHNKGFSHHRKSVLENQLGFTKEQIENAANSGKNAFDLAKEKGKTPDQLKSMITDQHSKELDQMVKDGKMTKDKSDTIKTNMKEKIKIWDGSLKHNQDKSKVS
jgi:polyhydroxyalkanoate synthesis regulator phasin